MSLFQKSVTKMPSDYSFDSDEFNHVQFFFHFIKRDKMRFQVNKESHKINLNAEYPLRFLNVFNDFVTAIYAYPLRYDIINSSSLHKDFFA